MDCGRRRFGFVPFPLALLDSCLDVEQDVGSPFSALRAEVLNSVLLLFVDASAIEHHGDVFPMCSSVASDENCRRCTPGASLSMKALMEQTLATEKQLLYLFPVLLTI